MCSVYYTQIICFYDTIRDPSFMFKEGMSFPHDVEFSFHKEQKSYIFVLDWKNR